MKKIFILCLISALLFFACKNTNSSQFQVKLVL